MARGFVSRRPTRLRFAHIALAATLALGVWACGEDIVVQGSPGTGGIAELTPSPSVTPTCLGLGDECSTDDECCSSRCRISEVATLRVCE